jgi:phytoene dehydrogenase-like protein
VWHHTGALNAQVKISYAEPFVEFDYNGTPIRLYRDVNKTERHLIEISPQDTKEIKRLCKFIRKMSGLSMPLTDIKGVKVTRKSHPPISLLFAALSAKRIMSKYGHISREEYAERFVHEGIREMLRALPGGDQGIPMFFLTFGALARGDGGFPEGGSIPFAQRMAQRFESLGGTIHFNTRVDRVVVEQGRAVGVQAGGTDFPADAVIIASDTMAVDQFFETPLTSEWLDKMKRETEPTTVTFVSLGIDAGLSDYPTRPLFTLKSPITLDDQHYKSLMVSSYATDHHYSPVGKTALTVQLPGDTYDFWKKMKEEGRYVEEKQRVGDAVISALEKQMPEMAGKVEVCDVATPLTYQRYCGGWKGSWMTAIKPNLDIQPYPATIDGLEGVYFAGQRMMPPGGFPPAVMSGRTAVQHLCRDTDTLFVSEE